MYPDSELTLKKIITQRLKNIRGLNNDSIKIILTIRFTGFFTINKI